MLQVNHVIKGQFYKRIVGKRPFHGHFVRFHGKKMGVTITMLYPNPCYNEVCYKWIAG